MISWFKSSRFRTWFIFVGIRLGLFVIGVAFIYILYAPPVLRYGRQQDQFLLLPISYDMLPGWGGDITMDATLPQFSSLCALVAKGSIGVLEQPSFRVTLKDWENFCYDFDANSFANADSLRIFLEKSLKPYLITFRAERDIRLTGYFHFEFSGSLTPTETYSYPIYARPADLITVQLSDFYKDIQTYRMAGRVVGNSLKPYYTRAEIDQGILKGKGLELAYGTPVDVYFLHIQGSGAVVLPDGSHLSLSYAGHNGFPYASIGKLLVSNQSLYPPISMQSIRRWLLDNPAQQFSTFHFNPSYIFFQLNSTPAVIGSMNVPLVAERSLAVDKLYIPLGTPIWLNTTYPSTQQPLQRLMMAQDTGSDILSPLVFDYYWGRGSFAGEQAGIMHETGNAYLLLPVVP